MIVQFFMFLTVRAYTQAAHDLRDDMAEASARLQYLDKDAEFHTGYRASHLSDMLKVRRPTDLWRWADMPPAWWKELVLVRARRFGLVVVEDALLARQVDAMDRFIVLMERLITNKRQMLRVTQALQNTGTEG